ncbi:unnamed protein product [Ambrosiozyma monospora]|uniref:Unnamed protein product n=1 Tax=Ambrosiozyma monospora TaxID=43982 RepID=A0A9W6YTT2_AMBMO|nr:unnamed protein product [Ambrosiozyma monospora]
MRNGIKQQDGYVIGQVTTAEEFEKFKPTVFDLNLKLVGLFDIVNAPVRSTEIASFNLTAKENGVPFKYQSSFQTTDTQTNPAPQEEINAEDRMEDVTYNNNPDPQDELLVDSYYEIELENVIKKISTDFSIAERVLKPSFNVLPMYSNGELGSTKKPDHIIKQLDENRQTRRQLNEKK